MQRCTYQAEGPYSSHHHRGAPRPGAPRLGRGSHGRGYALHTNTNNAPRVQLLAWACGTAVLGTTRGTPPPHNLAWAFGQDATSGIAHPGGGGWVGLGQGLIRTSGTTDIALPCASQLVRRVHGCPVSRPTGLMTAPVPRGGTRGREMPPCLCVWGSVSPGAPGPGGEAGGA